MRMSILLLVLLPLFASAQKYTPIDEGSAVRFDIVNGMLANTTVHGKLKGLQGSIVFNPDALNTASFDVSVESASISTGIGMRDKHLRNEEYLNAEGFPKIQFKSGKVTKAKQAGQYFVTGTLTMRGKSKAITFPFTATKVSEGMVFKGDFKINRQDFGVGPDNAIADELTVFLQVVGKPQ